MNGLRAPRSAIADCVNLANSLKGNIDDFKLEIKKNRPELKKGGLEDIKLLKQIFAKLDDILEDFSNIYTGEIAIKEWDYLFPQIIQSLIDIDHFMKNQFPTVYGFNAAKDLPAYIGFQRSIKRIRKLGVGQRVELEPTKGSDSVIVSKISNVPATRILDGPPPPGHPNSCGPSTHAPQNLNDWMKLYAGKYKLSTTGFPPHCPPNSAPRPYAVDHGWFTLRTGVYCDSPRPKFSDLGSIYLSSWESRTWQENGWPNNSHGGCSRNFEDYYEFVIEQLEKNKSQTLLIYKVEGQGETISSDTQWVRITYSSMFNPYPGSYVSSPIVGTIQNIESNIPDIMNQIIADVFSSSATCGIDPKTGDEIANIDLYPTYYYMFFETGWGNYDPPALRVYAPHERGLRYDESSKKLLAPDREQGSPAEPRTSTACPADINNDGFVDVDDLLQLITSWGDKGGPADIDGDGIVGVSDLLELISAWGPCSDTIYPYKLLASDGTWNDWFGYSVAVDGDTVVVGAIGDNDNGNTSGSAYIYQFDGSSWIETKIRANDGTSGDYFGTSVAISGDTVVVGANGDDANGPVSGSAYIYRFDGKNWIETKIVANDGTSGDYFGESVAVSGDTVVVGARLSSPSGSAYIYRFDGENWIQTKLTASDGTSSDSFGVSVAVSGDTVVVGAIWDDDNGIGSGSAYIYEFVGGVWEETKLTASDGAENDSFGRSVAISGDTAIVGAYLADNDTWPDTGAAYIFQRTSIDASDSNGGFMWTQQAKLTAHDPMPEDHFGYSVSIYNDTAVIGMPNDDENGPRSGSSFVFRLKGNVWRQDERLLPSDGEGNEYFGYSVSISSDGTTAIMGAYNDDDNNDGSGSAYIYKLGTGEARSSDGDFDSWKSAWIIAQSKDSLAANIILQEMYKRFTFDDINLGIPTTTSTSVPTPSPESSLQSSTPSPSPSPSPTPPPAPPPPPSPTPETEGYD